MREQPKIGSRVVVRYQRNGIDPATELGEDAIWPYCNGATGTVMRVSETDSRILMVRYDNPPEGLDRDNMTFHSRLEYTSVLASPPDMCRAAEAL